MKTDNIIIYTDGGSRGNPGNAASAYLIVDEDLELIHEDVKFIGKNTNNVAEYMALIHALDYAQKLKSKKVTCYSDSELMVRQIKGQYKVKKPYLKELYDKVRALSEKFPVIEFNNVRRSDKMIPRADALVNQCLDEQQYKRR